MSCVASFYVKNKVFSSFDKLDFGANKVWKEIDVPLLDETVSEESMSFLDEASAHFLRAVKQHYTRDTAVDIMEALTPILGKDWKGRVIFGIMANKYKNIRNLRIVKNVNDSAVQKINAIKEVRMLTAIGLTEAKNLVEQAYYQPMDVMLKTPPADTSAQDWDRQINSSISVLRNAGFTVEIA